MSASLDIGLCITQESGHLSRLNCLGNDGKNFCCKSASSALLQTGQMECCSRDEYADQIWVTVAIVKGFSVLLAMIFVYLLLVAGWFYLRSRNIRETEVRKSRREVIGHLLKQQVLRKLDQPESSVVSHLRNLSRSLSSSARRHLEQRKRRKQLEEEKAAAAPRV